MKKSLTTKLIEYLEFEIEWMLHLEYDARRSSHTTLNKIVDMLYELGCITCNQFHKYVDQINENVDNPVILDDNDESMAKPEFEFEPKFNDRN